MRKWTLVVAMLVAALTLVVPAAAMADDGVTSRAQIMAGVSFRDQASTSSHVIRLLKTNEIVTVTDFVTTNWYKIKDAQGVSGYVSTNTKYIKMISNANRLRG